MTVLEIRQAVEDIRMCKDDSCKAHGMEDSLYIYVLELISEGTENPQGLATAALEASKIQYERWYE